MKQNSVQKLFTPSGLFLLVFFSLFFSVWLLRDLIIHPPKPTLSTLTQVPNDLKNKLFNLPTGNFFFQVSSASTIQGPIFLEGEINPPDVHIGDIQHLKIIVQSPSGIKSVTARIETDNGEDIVELTRTGSISFKDMQSEKYLVDDNGKLKILKGSEIALRHWIKIANEKLATAFSAKAASGDDKEMWEGSWTVHDTHDAIYHTTFIAEDNDGLTDSLTIAWSDACSIPLQGNWTLGKSGYQYDCTISSTDGVENGDITIESNNLVINAPFAFNPGHQINLTNNGQIIIGTGQIKKTYLWICDKDGDGYTSGSTMGTVYAQDNAPQCGGTGGSGTGFHNLYQKLVHYLEQKKAMAAPTCGSTTPVYTIRRYNFIGTNDCYNDSSNAHPNSTNFCVDNRGDGSWDYNCDGFQEKEFDQIGSCTSAPLSCHNDCTDVLIPGWKNVSATCGTDSEWLIGCTNTGAGGCITPDCSTACNLSQYTCENTNGITQQKTQPCR